MERKEATRRLRNVLKAESIRSEKKRTPGVKPLIDRHNYGTDCFGAEACYYTKVSRAIDDLLKLNGYRGVIAEMRGDFGFGEVGVTVQYIPNNIPASRGTKKVEV